MGISAALGSGALLPAGLGFRNLLINGDFRINQRGFTSTATSATYGFDRWRNGFSGGTATYSAQTFTLGNTITSQEPKNYARIVTASQSAASDYSLIAQKIEDVRTCAGQTVSISFWAQAGSGAPKISVELIQDFGTGGSPSSPAATYAGQFTLSTTWTRYTLTVVVPSILGKTIGTGNNDTLVVQFFTSAGSDFNSRTNSLGIQNATINLWGVQLEQNFQPTPFEQRPIGIELQLCQRYYQVWANSSATAGMTISTQWYSFPMIMSTPMRAGVRSTSFTIPSVLYGANTSIGSNSGAVAFWDSSRPHQFTLTCLLTSTPNSYSSVWCTFNGHTVVIDCEL